VASAARRQIFGGDRGCAPTMKNWRRRTGIVGGGAQLY